MIKIYFQFVVVHLLIDLSPRYSSYDHLKTSDDLIGLHDVNNNAMLALLVLHT